MDPADPFNADSVTVRPLLSPQSAEINHGVGNGADQGAGDQGLMVGYATDETPILMPLPIALAHAIARQLAAARHRGDVDWLRPDGKAQVSVRYRDGRVAKVSRVIVSTQHAPEVSQESITAWVHESLLPSALGEWFHPGARVSVNPSGSFIEGGPSADCGVTGRKTQVDSYGGAARHGGGAFSGKDPSKVDRSAAYFARWAARQVVQAGLARRVEIEVAYAIGEPEPVALCVETFGTGDRRAAEQLVRSFDWRPWAIVERLKLARPIYAGTTNYGHFGRAGFTWEA